VDADLWSAAFVSRVATVYYAGSRAEIGRNDPDDTKVKALIWMGHAISGRAAAAVTCITFQAIPFGP